MRKEIEEAMAITPRDRIYSEIVKSPGLHFREIQRRTQIATGALQYHLDYLRKKNFIFEKKEGKFSRFYCSQDQGTVNSSLMNLLRQDQVRKIALILLQKRMLSFASLKKMTGMTSSTASFHLQKLIDAGVVELKTTRGKEFYSIKNKEPLLEVLYSYKESFMDSLVDNFIDIWEKDL
jgi:predicted transcriptional regulator